VNLRLRAELLGLRGLLSALDGDENGCAVCGCTVVVVIAGGYVVVMGPAMLDNEPDAERVPNGDNRPPNVYGDEPCAAVAAVAVGELTCDDDGDSPLLGV
jgi:hypothetical protein